MKLKKVKSLLQWDSNPPALRLRKTCTIGYAKKTAEHVFKNDNVNIVKNDNVNIVKNDYVNIVKNDNVNIVKNDNINIVKNDTGNIFNDETSDFADIMNPVNTNGGLFDDQLEDTDNHGDLQDTDIIVETENRAPDGGWGWLIVLGTLFLRTIIGTITSIASRNKVIKI